MILEHKISQNIDVNLLQEKLKQVPYISTTEIKKNILVITTENLTYSQILHLGVIIGIAECLQLES